MLHGSEAMRSAGTAVGIGQQVLRGGPAACETAWLWLRRCLEARGMSRSTQPRRVSAMDWDGFGRRTWDPLSGGLAAG